MHFGGNLCDVLDSADREFEELRRYFCEEVPTWPSICKIFWEPLVGSSWPHAFKHGTLWPFQDILSSTQCLKIFNEILLALQSVEICVSDKLEYVYVYVIHLQLRQIYNWRGDKRCPNATGIFTQSLKVRSQKSHRKPDCRISAISASSGQARTFHMVARVGLSNLPLIHSILSRSFVAFSRPHSEHFSAIFFRGICL